jgi:hypothetical protein
VARGEKLKKETQSLAFEMVRPSFISYALGQCTKKEKSTEDFA